MSKRIEPPLDWKTVTSAFVEKRICACNTNPSGSSSARSFVILRTFHSPLPPAAAATAVVISTSFSIEARRKRRERERDALFSHSLSHRETTRILFWWWEQRRRRRRRRGVPFDTSVTALHSLSSLPPSIPTEFLFIPNCWIGTCVTCLFAP